LGWKIEFDKKAKKEFANLDKTIQKQIDKFILKLAKNKDPKKIADTLKGSLQSFWKYRIGNYRLVCSINEDAMTILILRVKHRKEVYKKDIE
jgi:mRNA interferase RelE/StbE